MILTQVDVIRFRLCSCPVTGSSPEPHGGYLVPATNTCHCSTRGCHEDTRRSSALHLHHMHRPGEAWRLGMSYVAHAFADRGFLGCQRKARLPLWL